RNSVKIRNLVRPDTKNVIRI
ncbi:unnamed protein product, partial [Allacma fusca]